MAKILYFTILIVLILAVSGCTTNEEEETPGQPQSTFGNGEQPQDTSEVPEGGIVINLDEESVEIDLSDDGSMVEAVTSEELVTHNSESDCWVGFEGQVYDLTDWLQKHPGTAVAIIPYCGTSEDFEIAFEDQHQNEQIGKIIKEGVPKGELV